MPVLSNYLLKSDRFIQKGSKAKCVYRCKYFYYINAGLREDAPCITRLLVCF